MAIAQWRDDVACQAYYPFGSLGREDHEDQVPSASDDELICRRDHFRRRPVDAHELGRDLDLGWIATRRLTMAKKSVPPIDELGEGPVRIPAIGVVGNDPQSAAHPHRSEPDRRSTR